jgi:hypothetical protein
VIVSRTIALAFVTTAATACIMPPPKYHYYDAQLGRRTWEVRARDVWPEARSDLDRFVLYRAAELTRGFGYRYFTVRSYSGNDADYRFFTVKASRAAETLSPSFPIVTDESERMAARARDKFLSHGIVTQLTWREVQIRLLEPEDVGDGSEAVDAEAVLQHLAPFIARRR